MVSNELLDLLGETYLKNQGHLKGWTFEQFVQAYIDGRVKYE
jgi:hypothetical protein